MATLWLTGRMDYGCHRARVSITLTDAQNVTRTSFSTMRPTRIASTVTPIFSVYQDRGGVLWVGTENAGLNILNFRQEQFVHYSIAPPTPIVSHPAGSRRFIRSPMAFCG